MKKSLKIRQVIFRLCVYGALFPPLLAGAFEEADLSPLYDLLKEGRFYTVGDFQGEKRVTLRYAKFGKGRGKNGSLVFINGKGENLFKYMELFYDFYLQGWSPIYTYDHRNQGFSDHVLSLTASWPVSLSPAGEVEPDASTALGSSGSLSPAGEVRPLPRKNRGEPESPAGEVKPSDPPPDPSATYVENYSLYKKDLEAFIRLVLEDGEVDRSRLFLIAHSMGGAVALDYLQTHPEKSPFKSAALSAPMIKIKSNLFPVLEKGTVFVLTGYCSFLPCTWRLPSLRSRFTAKTLTDSESRYAFSAWLEKRKISPGCIKGDLLSLGRGKF